MLFYAYRFTINIWVHFASVFDYDIDYMFDVFGYFTLFDFYWNLSVLFWNLGLTEWFIL